MGSNRTNYSQRIVLGGEKKKAVGVWGGGGRRGFVERDIAVSSAQS